MTRILKLKKKLFYDLKSQLVYSLYRLISLVALSVVVHPNDDDDDDDDDEVL